MENFSFKNVSFAYPEQENKALRNISFTVNQGEFLILCGPSGCGKSTLLRHLKTCLTPHGVLTGEILFGGNPLSETDERTQSQEIVFVLQFASGELQHLIHFGYLCAAIVHEVNLGQVALYQFVFEPTIAVWFEIRFKDIFTFVPFATVFILALIILLVGEAHIGLRVLLLP